MRERFIGAWRLRSFEYRKPDGETVHPLGEDATGSLVYHDSGRFSLHISRRDRPVFTSGYFKHVNVEELKVALSGYFAYFGTFQVNEDHATIVHFVEGSLFPNWVGSDQLRYYQFVGEQLTLESPLAKRVTSAARACKCGSVCDRGPSKPLGIHCLRDGWGENEPRASSKMG